MYLITYWRTWLRSIAIWYLLAPVSGDPSAQMRPSPISDRMIEHKIYGHYMNASRLQDKTHVDIDGRLQLCIRT
ncbi:hypothetical protein XSR1_570005 [Xenorhabdus szentirmaii DSM 16338]|uniref:Uncharacterized protein n=1 Tax=Xenorhabdus szentirmaii DSM 16338 TaxID=1427518 RepID=W1J2E3_9GAMM|nr:hypothetical protein XSR1_570005 [Xenorhabdus szentirmaii DSM 16338]